MSAKTRYLKLMDRPRKGWKLADRAVFLRRFVEEAAALIEEGLARDGVVKIHEFGTFQLKWIEARAGRNPRTGEAIPIPGQYRISFRPVEKLESRVNWPYAHLKAELIEPPPVAQKPKAAVMPEKPALPEPVPLFEWEEESAEPEPVPAYAASDPAPPPYRPSLSWSPASPPPSTLRLDFMDEEDEPAPAKTYGDNRKEDWREEQVAVEVKTGPSEIVPAPAASHSVAPHVRRPSYMQERERERGPGRAKWFAIFGAVLLLLLFFAKPIREQWVHLNQAADPATVAPPPRASDQPPPAPAPTVGFAGGTHQVVNGDNLWGISGHYYVDPYLWPNIYRVNTDKISNPDLLTPAQILALPILYGTHEKLTPQDRRNLAEGYFLVFNHYKQTQKHLAPFALWAAVRFDRAILDTHKEAIGEDELAFLEAHNVAGVAAR